MERSVIVLQYFLVILLVKYATSSTNCICEFPADFCQPNITAVQGKVLGSQLANETGDLVTDISMAHKTRYRVELLHRLINGSHELLLENNAIFKIPVPLGAPCNFNFTKGSNYVFVGDVNGNGRWSKLNCYLNIRSRDNENGSGTRFDLGGDDMNFSDLCTNL
ncbi:hypothetical protein ACJMK2_031503 [Sinanodonta woodiana]|uniref:Uncharacterized protein n=1 Tax=Sinanodonta woodiana TaxID=1069815 RepID=A0ABD3WZ13_SINWO